MKIQKQEMLWYVNVGMFLLFILLSATGLINWLVLPRGSEAGATGFLMTMRHFLRDVHDWSALAFIALAVFHLILHKKYIINSYTKYFIKK